MATRPARGECTVHVAPSGAVPGKPSTKLRITSTSATGSTGFCKGVIPSEALAKLFEPFSQGLDLGLFIARALVRAHQGDIEVDSSPERGTTFRFALPRHASVAERPSDTVAA